MFWFPQDRLAVGKSIAPRPTVMFLEVAEHLAGLKARNVPSSGLSSKLPRYMAYVSSYVSLHQINLKISPQGVKISQLSVVNSKASLEFLFGLTPLLCTGEINEFQPQAALIKTQL